MLHFKPTLNAMQYLLPLSSRILANSKRSDHYQRASYKTAHIHYFEHSFPQTAVILSCSHSSISDPNREEKGWNGANQTRRAPVKTFTNTSWAIQNRSVPLELTLRENLYACRVQTCKCTVTARALKLKKKETQTQEGARGIIRIRAS